MFTLFKMHPIQLLFRAMMLAACVAPAFNVLGDEPNQPTVTLQILDYEGLQELIAGHKGKVVVMDCWATYCAPCLQEFPNLVALHRKYGAEKVACVSLSFDYEGLGNPEDVQAEVLKFLKQQGATFDNVLSSEPADDLYKKLGLAAVPAVFVYGRDGKLAEKFTGNHAYDEVPALVERLLGEP